MNEKNIFKVEFGKTAYRIFKKLPLEVKDEIREKGRLLKNNPLRGEPLQGKFRKLRSLHFTVKGTQYRIIYQLFEEIYTVVIVLADTRENIYRKLEEKGF